MPLSMARIGEQKSILKILGDDALCHRLQDMGFIPGEDVVVVNEMAGNLIVSVKGSRVALTKGLANKILLQ